MIRCSQLSPHAAIAIAACVAVGDAAAQDGPAPVPVGPYLVAAVGGSRYEHDCYFFGSCRDGSATFFKVGAGYRFGVVAAEVWGFDFGRADLGGDDFNPPTSLHMRAIGAGAAWTAHFGRSFEATWRVGGAEVRHEGADAPSADSFQPYAGMSGTFRLAEPVALELGVDILRGRDGDGLYTHVTAFSLGVHLRF